MKPSEVLRTRGRARGELLDCEGRVCLVGAFAYARYGPTWDLSFRVDQEVYEEFQKHPFGEALQDVIDASPWLRPGEPAWNVNDQTLDDEFIIELVEKAEAECGWVWD